MTPFLPYTLIAFCLLGAADLRGQSGPPGNYNWIWNQANGHYYALTAPQSWASAAAEADTLGPNTNLVTIRSAQENVWIQAVFIKPGSRLWIGFTDQQAEGSWVWRSSEPVTYTNWAPGTPNGGASENCTLINDAGGWDDWTLTGWSYPAILEWRGNVNGPPGNHNWVRNPANGHHYVLTPPTTWSAGASLADSLGGSVDLVTIRSQAENSWIYNVLEVSALTYGAYIGLNDVASEGNWVWRSQEPVVYANWGPGEPNGFPWDADDYAELGHHIHQGPVWNDGGGDFIRPAVLEWIPPTGPDLSRTGACPGAVALSISGATPNGLLAILYGQSGTFTKLTPPCAGIVLDLARPSLAALIPADGQGSASMSFQAPAGACGRSVQCVDVQSCSTTNVVVL